LLAADDLTSAVTLATRACAVGSGGPAAGWLADGSLRRLSLVAVEGTSAGLARRVRKALPLLRRHRSNGSSTWSRAGRAFAGLVGADGWAAVDAGDAVVLVATPGGDADGELDQIGPLLSDVLTHLKEIERARRRNQDLDLGIALTAHEIRGPALAASAAIGAALAMDPPGDESRALLVRSLADLRSLGAVAESMMKWSAGGEPIRRRPTDLVAVVREAIETSRATGPSAAVRVSAPSRLTIRGDRTHLRTAVANVVRNALSFSPPARPVQVSVARTDQIASVVVEDRGPGIPLEEREGIFDPFVRGRRAARARNGNGLGLFIARQVVEAHRGAIWMEGGDVGARFHIELPVR
jgi:signal transduction histidine kinase